MHNFLNERKRINPSKKKKKSIVEFWDVLRDKFSYSSFEVGVGFTGTYIYRQAIPNGADTIYEESFSNSFLEVFVIDVLVGAGTCGVGVIAD